MGRGTVFHWGPLLAITIISLISITMVTVSLSWWPLTSVGGQCNMAVFLFWVSMILYHLFTAIYTGPGYIPHLWIPDIEGVNEKLQYCTICQGYKAPRSHHCRKCQRCVMKMDHHCPWINNCVGHRNHVNFLLFTLFCPIGCLHATFTLCSALYYSIFYNHYYMQDIAVPYMEFSSGLFVVTMFSVGLGGGVVVAVSFLFGIQLKSILKNETSIETWIKEKAVYRRVMDNQPENFVYPYNLGRWINLRMVLHCRFRPELDGYFGWPVLQSCDQYTLTIEQIYQKQRKKSRAVPHKITLKYTGSMCPLYTGGVRACYGSPCTDEQRIAVNPGDMVVVTRWKKHWLYGTLMIKENTPSGDLKEVKRGWFLRKCAREIYDSKPKTE